MKELKCKNCGHTIKRDREGYIHQDEYALSTICNQSVKSNKKIRHTKRNTEPIRYLPCGCELPQAEE